MIQSNNPRQLKVFKKYTYLNDIYNISIQKGKTPEDDWQEPLRSLPTILLSYHTRRSKRYLFIKPSNKKHLITSLQKWPSFRVKSCTTDNFSSFYEIQISQGIDFGRFFIIILLIKWTESQLCLICTNQNICEICDNPKCDQLSLYVVKALPGKGY